MNKMMTNTVNEIKVKRNQLNNMVKMCKEDRKKSSASVMMMVEEGRQRLDCLFEGERKQRCEYEEIVMNLLDRTVDQGEQILRRIG